MTTHGRGGLARAWLGSVADALVRQNAIPVLLSRPTQEPVMMDKTRAFRRILLPTDGSLLIKNSSHRLLLSILRAKRSIQCCT